MLSRFSAAQSIAAAIAALTALSADAVAQQTRPAPSPKQQARPAQPKEAVAPRDAGEPVMAIVSIKSQQFTLYDADGWILRAPVSTGVKERETPAGIFAVVEKKEDHRSNMYDDAHMPHMQRITWNGIALHGGPLPGYAASHGCVRLPFGFAEKLFGKTRIGMRVIISPNDAAPVEVSHPALLCRTRRCWRQRRRAPSRSPARPRRPRSAADEAKKAAAAATRERSAARLAAQAGTAEGSRRRRARARREGACRREDGQDQGESRGGASRRLPPRPRKRRRSSRPPGPRRRRSPTPAAVKEAAKAAETKKAAAAKAALEAKLALEPVSIYISRATQKLYVRRNTHKPAPDGGGTVFDSTIEVPITIRDPFRPIGTHVFTAVAREDAGLRWTAVTIDGDDARSALDRITIPKDVLDRIAPTALPRSSIIISDEPLSEETNYRTEFVAVLSNQPQGGFITRERTPMVAANDPYGDDGSGWFFQRNSPARLGLSGGLGPQPSAQRSGSPQPAPQRSWGSQSGNSDWFADPYQRRERQRW